MIGIVEIQNYKFSFLFVFCNIFFFLFVIEIVFRVFISQHFSNRFLIQKRYLILYDLTISILGDYTPKKY